MLSFSFGHMRNMWLHVSAMCVCRYLQYMYAKCVHASTNNNAHVGFSVEREWHCSKGQAVAQDGDL